MRTNVDRETLIENSDYITEPQAKYYYNIIIDL